MGIPALIDAGYYENGSFNGKDGTWSKQDFLNNPKAQENAVRQFHEKKWKQLSAEVKEITKKDIKEYIGKTINGITITPSGLLIASHLVGQHWVARYLKNNGRANTDDEKEYFFDGNGTHIEEYMVAFADYNVSKITNIPHKAYALENYMKKDIDEYKKSSNNLANTKISGMFKSETISDKTNSLDKEGKALLQKAEDFYKDQDTWILEKYSNCKNLGKEAKYTHIKPLTFEQYRKEKNSNKTSSSNNNVKYKEQQNEKISYDNNSDMGMYETAFRAEGPEKWLKYTNISINGKKPTEEQWKYLYQGYTGQGEQQARERAKKVYEKKQAQKVSRGQSNSDDDYWYTSKSGKHIHVTNEKKYC